MAGHSQFKNIMYRKGAQDKKRAKIFTKIIRELTTAARTGLPEVAANPRLRAAVTAAKEANMPKDTVERAIRRGAGGEDGENYEEVRYEGYGPGGVAIIVEAVADNVESGAPEHVVTCAPEALNTVRDALERRFGASASARLVWKPKTQAPVEGHAAEALFKLLETLEDSDDVQNVFANFEVSDEVMARLSA